MASSKFLKASFLKFVILAITVFNSGLAISESNIEFNFASDHGHFLIGHDVNLQPIYEQTVGSVKLTVTPKSTTTPHLEQCHGFDQPHDIYVHQSLSGLGVKYHNKHFWQAPFLDSGLLDTYSGYTDRLEFKLTNANTNEPIVGRVQNIRFKRFQPLLFLDNAYIDSPDHNVHLNVSKHNVGHNLHLELFPTSFLNEHTVGSWRFDTDFNASEFTITPGKFDAFKVYGLTIEVEDDSERAPEIVSTPLLTAFEGGEYTYSLQALPALDDYQYQLTTFPEGMVVDVNSGEIHWLPSYDQSGSHSVVIEVINQYGQKASQSFNVEVANTNRTPIVTTDPLKESFENSSYQYQFGVVDPDDDALTFELKEHPEGMQINNTGLISWTPTYEQAGEYGVLVQASDGQLSVEQAFTIKVINVNRLPIILSTSSAEILENSIFTHQLNTFDPDNQMLAYSLAGSPSNMMIDESGVVKWQPNYDQAGVYTFTINVSDGISSVHQQFTLTVVNSNRAPQIMSTAIMVGKENQQYSYAVMATDADGDQLTYELLTSPSGMNIDSTGKIQWTPNHDESGAHSVTVRVSDGELSDDQSFVIQVENVNRKPTFFSVPVTQTLEKTEYVYIAKANDADNEALKYTLLVAPAGMNIDENSGQISWLPTASDIGSHYILITAADESSAVAEQGYTLFVENVNDAPIIISSPNLNAKEGSNYIYQVDAFDEDGDELKYSLSSALDGMFIDGITGMISWVPNFEQAGLVNVSINVTDSSNAVVIQDYNLDVVNTNRAPIPSLISPIKILALNNLQGNISVIDPDGDSLVYTLISGPNNFILDSNTGGYSWQTTSSDVGEVIIVVGISDSIDSVETQFLVEVLPANQPPKINNDPYLSAVVGVEYSFQLLVDDVEGDELTYSISGREFLSISQDGLIKGMPLKIDEGAQSIVVSISDGLNVVDYNFQLNVVNLVDESAKNWGKNFWYGDILNGTNVNLNRNLKIFITSLEGAKGTIETPANPGFLPVEFEVPENGVIEINYPIAQDVLKHDSITPKGIYIAADNDVGIYSLVFDENNTDALTLIPANKLGKEYVLSGYNDFYWSPSEYAVIATEDNTLLTLEPNGVFERADRNKINPGEKLEIILQKGEMYYFNSVFQETLGLTGSPLYADKPIAAIVRHTCSMVPIQSKFCDRLVEQLPPTKEWGTQHALVPYASRKKDLVRIVANEDNTQITINGYVTRYINKGEFWEYHLTEPQYVESSSPVLISHFSASDYFDKEERSEGAHYNTSIMRYSWNGFNRSQIFYDFPNFKTTYNVTIDPDFSEINSVILYVHEDDIANVTLDGVALETSRFRELYCIDCPTNNEFGLYRMTQLALSPGDHIVESNLPFGMYENVDGLEFMADPFLAFEVPLDLALDHYIFTVSNDYYSRHFVTIVIEDTFKSSVMIDGEPVDSRYFKDLPGSPYAYAKLAVNPGKHDIKAADDFSLIVYGFDHHDSYGFSGGVGHATPLETALIQIQENKFEKSIGEEACISGQLLSLDYTPLEDKAIDISVSGSHEITSRIFSERNGEFKYCYIGEQANVDSIDVKTDSVSKQVTIDWGGTPNTNLPPIITSQPVVYVTAGEQYTYQVEAIDPNGDSITFELQESPEGMLINTDGLITWQSINGTFDVTVKALDSGSEYNSQKIRLVANNLPQIVTEPVQLVTDESSYFGLIEFRDTDSDGPVKCRLTEAPVGFLIKPYGNGMTQCSVYSPSVYVGKYPFTLMLEDSSGGILNYSYSLTVIEAHKPEILNSPSETIGYINEIIEFQIDAVDRYGDAMKLSVTSSNLDGKYIPKAVIEVDEKNLILRWESKPEQFGTLNITYKVDHEFNGTAHGELKIHIENRDFEITSTPITSARVSYDYKGQITVVDLDNQEHQFVLVSGPSGMTVDQNGLITWLPTEDQIGIHEVTIEVRDGKHIHGQTFEITVQASDTKLSSELIVSKRVVDPDEVFEVSGGYQNPLGEVTESLTVNGAAVSLSAEGKALVSLIEPGAHSLLYTVSDSIESVSVEKIVYVKDPNDVTLPVVTLDSPINGVDLSAPQTILGSVTDEQLIYWQIQLQKGNEPTATVLAEGESNIDAVAELATLDTTLMENGLYRLTLYAIDLGGNEGYAQSLFNVVGDLKVGNVQFSIEDLNIPVSGLPISVVRSYNSLRRSQELDFGYGWSVGYQDVTIDESMEPTKGWYQYVTQALFKVDADSFVTKATCIAPIGQKEISITLPDGEVASFIAKAKAVDGGIESASHEGCYATRGRYFIFEFEAKEGTDSTLSLNEYNDYNFYLTHVDDGHLTSDIIETSYTPISSYSLTTKQGYVYNLNQKFGIESIIDPNGHVLTYTEDGIEHSLGKGIEFIRDDQGRIRSIIDAAGNTVMSYEYDSFGNLQFAKDATAIEQSSNGIEYTYTSDHNIIDIIDPLGRPVVKNIYDDDGRLTGQEDANGNIKTFDHDINARTSIITDLDGRSTIFNYDDEGNVTQDIKVISDASYDSDIVTTFGYDSNGNQLSKSIGDVDHTWLSTFEGDNQTTATDPEGNTVQYQNYNEKGQEGLIIDELGRQTVMEYDAAGNLKTIQMPELINADTGQVLNLSASNVINQYGQITQTTDLRDLVTNYTYYSNSHESAGQKHTESNPVTGTTTYTYDANNNIKTETRQRTVNGEVQNETVSYNYDKLNRLIKTTYPDTSYSETVYDLAGNLDKERDRFGTWTDFEYDGYGRLIQTDYADGTFEKREYSAEGLLKNVMDVSGKLTAYQYDDAGRQWKVTYPDNSFIETRYTPQGWVKSETDARGNLTEYQYDKAGKRKKVLRHINGVIHTHEFDYYKNGELKTETDSNLHSTEYQINAFDQRIQTQFHNGTTTGQRYDAMGARTKQIDQNDRSTQYGYDALGLLKSVQAQVEINGESVPATHYTYDEQGNKLTQTDAEGRTTSWTYDYFGRVLSRTLPEGMSETFNYDDANRTVVHTDFKNQITTTVNDVMGRVSNIHYDDGKSETFTYWPSGQVNTIVASETGKDDQITSYTYDNRDRLKTETQASGTVLSYDYDAIGNRTQVKITKGEGESQTVTTTDYTYDDLNRLETVIDGSGTTTYTYDAVGNQKTVTMPNGVVSTYKYNHVNQLANLTTQNANGEVLSSYSYELDDTGRRESITEIRAEQDGRYTSYSYDNLYRLTDEVIKQSIDATSENYRANYQYDWVGNRTYETVDGVSTAYSYDLNDRLTSQGGTTYSYDNNGNTLTESIDSTVKTYSYDAKDKLIGVSTTEADVEVSSSAYSYNVNGIRNSKTEDGVTTSYVVDSNRDYAQVLEEVVDGLSTVTYSYGHDLLSQNRSDEFKFYLYDGLGSTRTLSNSAGVVTDTYDYKAFGDVLNETGDTDNNYKFTGEQFDSSLDQYYLRARYYDQGVGRFTQQDTYMGNNYDPVSLHKYLYANAAPSMYTDPTGNFSISGMMTSLNVMGRLIGGSIARTPTLLSRAATGTGNFARGALKILNQSKGYIRAIAKRCKTNKKKSSACGYAKGLAEAELKVQMLVSTTPNSRKRGPSPVVVVVGAFDSLRGRGTAAFNGFAKGTTAIKQQLKRRGLNIGQENACGTGNTVGRCAEYRAAHNLLRSGSKLKNMFWTPAYYVTKGPGGHLKIQKEAKYCNVCQTGLGL